MSRSTIPQRFPADSMKSETVPSITDVSICILNWNGSRMLADCLQSLRDIRRANHSRFEIIVVDNGSTDDSVEMVRRDFPEARLVTIPKNISISAAINQALLLCSSRYCLILNNDIVLHGDCLDQMSNFLDRNPRAGIACARLLNRDGSTQVNYYPRQLPTVRSVVADLFRMSPAASGGDLGWDTDVPCRMEQVPGACMMVRGAVFREIGLWDPEFTCWYEDVDFCCRCLHAGWENWYLPEARVTHYGGSTFRKLGMSEKALWRFHGLLRYSAKHFSRSQYTLVRALVFLALILRLPVVTLFCLSPSTEVRRTWKGIVPAYLRLIAKLSRSQHLGLESNHSGAPV